VTFSASARDRVRHCPASAALPQINAASQWSDTGNEGHDAVCAFVGQVREGASDGAALNNAPPAWQALCEDLLPLAPYLRPELALAINVETGQGRVLGENIKRRYTLEEFEVAGTADLAGVIDGVAVVVDLKTGWAEHARAEVHPQLRLLALMAARAWNCDQAKVAVLVCHEGDTPRWQWAELEAWDLDETALELRSEFSAVRNAETVVRAGQVPNVNEGSWCKYCPATPVCPAKTALVKRLASGAEGDELDMMIPLDARTAGIAYERVQWARAILNRVESAVHAYIDEHGSIELPNGKLLKKLVVDGNEKLDGDVVYGVAYELFGQGVADIAVERHATKKRLEQAMRENFGRSGAAKSREVLDEVRRRGGASRGKSTRLVEVAREVLP
jgi:Protein of unknown function (DUF2800)